ncbi:sigma 54-interacting transcriptional regulator [Candidatus Margulisiibacteriota bacterium]
MNNKIVSSGSLSGTDNPIVQASGQSASFDLPCLQVDEQRAIYGHPHTLEWLQEATAPILSKNVSVLIQGPTGTGKTLLGRHLYNQYIQLTGLKGLFVAVNCGAIPEQLIESELFGYVKGAFTGATLDKKGLIQKAENGVLFLDEIGELPLAMQVKLLSVLEDKVIRPVGSIKEISVDFRLICATNADLEALVREGKFREDLYNRIAVYLVNLPGLSERFYDIPFLVNSLLSKHAKEQNLQNIAVTADALRFLSKEPWSGNIRELDNFLFRLLLCSQGKIIITMDEVNAVLKPATFQPPENANTMLEEALVKHGFKPNKQAAIDKAIRRLIKHGGKSGLPDAKELLREELAHTALIMCSSQNCSDERSISEQAAELLGTDEDSIIGHNKSRERRGAKQISGLDMEPLVNLGWEKVLKRLEKALGGRAISNSVGSLDKAAPVPWKPLTMRLESIVKKPVGFDQPPVTAQSFTGVAEEMPVHIKAGPAVVPGQTGFLWDKTLKEDKPTAARFLDLIVKKPVGFDQPPITAQSFTGVAEEMPVHIKVGPLVVPGQTEALWEKKLEADKQTAATQAEPESEKSDLSIIIQDMEPFIEFCLQEGNTREEAIALLKAAIANDAVFDCGSQSKAAPILGVSQATLGNAITAGRKITEARPDLGEGVLKCGDTLLAYVYAEDHTLKEAVDIFDKELILRALYKTGNNKSKAAVILGVSGETIHNLLNKYNLREEFAKPERVDNTDTAKGVVTEE